MLRDLLFTLLVLGLLPVCFRRPFIGLLVFSWLAYMRGQDMTWGWARETRWSFYVALVTLAGYFTKERSRFFVPDARCYLMLLMMFIVGVGVALSRSPDKYQFSRYIEFCKIIAVALFTTGIVRTREQLRVLIWVVALSLGFLGVKYGIWGILTLGRGQILQGPGGLLADNNDLSLAMAMVVPLLLNIGLSERNETLKRAFLITVPLTVITVVLTHSRGGFLSISAAFFVLAWRSRNRVGGVLLLLLVFLAGFLLAPDSYKKRLSTLQTYEEDSSARGRLKSWAVAVRMATDNPILGVGFGKFRQHYLEYEIAPTPEQLSGKDVIVAHNSYLQIWAECGTPVFMIYLGMIGLTFATLWRVRRKARGMYADSWILHYSSMFEASLVAFMVGSTFLNRGHFDLLYHFVAIVQVFGIVAEQEMSAGPVRASAEGRGELGLARLGGFGARRKKGGFRDTVLRAEPA